MKGLRRLVNDIQVSSAENGLGLANVVCGTTSLLSFGDSAVSYCGESIGDLTAQPSFERVLWLLLHQSPAPISSALQIPITASFGVGCLPAGSEGTFAWLYAAADKALYDAKRLGRDRVERVEPDASLTPSDFQRMRR